MLDPAEAGTYEFIAVVDGETADVSLEYHGEDGGVGVVRGGVEAMVSELEIEWMVARVAASIELSILYENEEFLHHLDAGPVYVQVGEENECERRCKVATVDLQLGE